MSVLEYIDSLPLCPFSMILVLFRDFWRYLFGCFFALLP